MTDTTPEAPRGLDARLPRAELEAVYAAEFRRADEEGWARRLFEKDATLWSADPIVQEKIAAAAERTAGNTDRMKELMEEDEGAQFE